MTSSILASYFAFLFNTGQMPVELPAPAAKPAIIATARPAPVRPAIIVETETRGDRGPAATTSLDLGAEIVVTTAGAIDVATAPTASDVVDEVQKFYKDIKQVTAKFRQEVVNATFGKSTTSDGKVWIKKPGMMRWDYYSKPKKGKTGKKTVETMKSFISNGSYLYVVEHQNKQVIEKDLSKNMLPVAVTFLYGKGDLKADFDAILDTTKKYGAKNDFVLKLTPKTPSAQYKNLYLVVDKTNYRVKQSVIIDSAGNVNNFRFYEPDFDKAVKDTWFKFDKKDKAIKNYRIITDDDDQPPPSASTGSGATKKTDPE